jgi:hypothetical protein
MGVIRSRKLEESEDAAVTDSHPTTPETPDATAVSKAAKRPAGYRSFAGSVRRICVEAVRKARSLLPGAGSRPPKN